MQNQCNKQLKRQNLTNAMLALREELCNANSGGRERIMLEKDLITCIYRMRRNGDKGTKAKHQSHNSRKRNCNSELQGPQLSFTHDMDEKNWILRIILTIWLDFGNIDWITVEERNYIDWITLEEKNNFFLSFEMLYWGSLDPMRQDTQVSNPNSEMRNVIANQLSKCTFSKRMACCWGH